LYFEVDVYTLLKCYSMAAIFRRMSAPVALIAVRALASAAMNAVASSSDYGTQHKKLILLLLAQTVVQVYLSLSLFSPLS
jgi:hypothetical protein